MKPNEISVKAAADELGFESTQQVYAYIDSLTTRREYSSRIIVKDEKFEALKARLETYRALRK